MSFQDKDCNCDSYSCSRFHPYQTPDAEAECRKEPIVPFLSPCCIAPIEERVLQTYSGETILYICSACGKNCEPPFLPKEY